MDKHVAIVAYSFRFPGTDTQHFWSDLLAQKDCITQVEANRWAQDALLHPDKRHAGTSYTFAGGSIGDVSLFDAAFFGISPREATVMDPQQRILLEYWYWNHFQYCSESHLLCIRFTRPEHCNGHGLFIIASCFPSSMSSYSRW